MMHLNVLNEYEFSQLDKWKNYGIENDYFIVYTTTRFEKIVLNCLVKC